MSSTDSGVMMSLRTFTLSAIAIGCLLLSHTLGRQVYQRQLALNSKHGRIAKHKIGFIVRRVTAPRRFEFIPDFLNDRGMIVGVCLRNHDMTKSMIAVRKRGNLRFVANGKFSIAQGINQHNWILLRPIMTQGRASLWCDHRNQSLPFSPLAFNNSLQVVGVNLSADRKRLIALLWDHGKAIDISESQAEIVPVAINDSGTILGIDHYEAIGLGTHASIGIYLRTRHTGWSKVYELSNQGIGTKISPDKFWLNSKGEIVMSYIILGQNTLDGRAILWTDGRGFSLGFHRDIRLSGMNNSGDIIGKVWSTSLHDWTPFLWHDGQLQELSKLISNPTVAKIDEAIAINNTGEILGLGRYAGHPGIILL